MTHIGHYTRCNANQVPIPVAETKRRAARIAGASAVCRLSESQFSLLARVFVPEGNFIDFQDSKSIGMNPSVTPSTKAITQTHVLFELLAATGERYDRNIRRK